MTAAGHTGRRVIGESGLVLGSPCAQGSRRLGGAGPLSRGTTGGGGGGRQRALFCQWQRPPARERWHLGSGQAAKPHTIHQERALGKFQAEHLRQIAGKFKSHCVVCSQALVGAGPPTLTSTGPPTPRPQEAGHPRSPASPALGAALEPAAKVQNGTRAAGAKNGRSCCSYVSSSFYLRLS